METIFDINAIDLSFKNKATKKLEVIKEVIESITVDLGLDSSTICSEVLNREAQSTTGFGKNLAIPHSQIEGLSRAIVVITRYETEVEWESMDGEPVKQTFMILVPKGSGDNSHLKILSQLARKMMNEEFVTYVKSCNDKAELLEYLNTQITL